MNNIKIVIYLSLIMFVSSCVTNKNMNEKVNLFSQYSYLLERSILYDEGNEKFKYKIKSFIDTCTEERPGLTGHVSPFLNNELGGPTILLPYLFNNNQDEVIIMVLTKDRNLKGMFVDKVQYVIGQKKENNWIFKMKKAHVRRFSYLNNHPTLSDTEISLRILSTFISWEYMTKNTIKINDDFFKQDW